MFKEAESGNKISKKEYEDRLPVLRHELLQTQFALRDAGIPMIIIMAGVEGSGKGEVVNRINSWMDTRGIETHVFKIETDEMRKRPFFWRFWKVMPPNGRISIFFGSWYTKPILSRMFAGLNDNELDDELRRIRFLENMLIEDGTVIAKFWLHISKHEQYNRLKKLESGELTKWRVSAADWKYHKNFNRFTKVSARAIRKTDTESSPWHIVDAAQKRHRDLHVMEHLLNLMKNALHRKNEASGVKIISAEYSTAQNLKETDLTNFIEPGVYSAEYDKLNQEIEYLAWQCYQKEISSVFVFEGWDAAGKGGVIRRLIASLDAKLYRVIQIAAPTDEERAHHYLWRFWRHIPADGKITIYDRSWYGRVLVERVEEFADPSEWNRAYHEINDFEMQLADHGTVIKKFWLQISSDEQLRRFKEREIVDYKRYKLTDEDWRNRERRDEYEMAVNDMIQETDKSHAPWYIIPAEDKNYARIRVMRIVRDGMLEALEGR
jgi:AMP-polyphosphate phosphotransferase